MPFARPRYACHRPAALIASAALFAVSPVAGAVEAPLAADTYVTSAATTANFGATATLNVGAGATSLLRFDLSTLPAGTKASNVSRATLVLYVNRVGVPGSLEVQTISGPWSESTVNAGSAPVISRNGGAPVVAVELAAQFITLDVTAYLSASLAAGNSGSLGLALQGTADKPGATVFFDSKENLLTGRAARLDVALTGQGPSGPAGLPGDVGATGASSAVAGPTGAAGPRGEQGDAGIAGPVGTTGAAGPSGAQGPMGAPGASGGAGPAGMSGLRGDPGVPGSQGLKGDTGLAGPVGQAGSAGTAGAAGPRGSVGSTGALGPRGVVGPSGPAGPVGLAGGSGVPGPLGARGAAGPTGAQGLPGPRGATGPAGYGPSDFFGAAPQFQARSGQSLPCTIAAVRLYAGSIGIGMPADGRILHISDYYEIFSLIGTQYGGDGVDIFALPDLRSVTPNGLTSFICVKGEWPQRL